MPTGTSFCSGRSYFRFSLARAGAGFLGKSRRAISAERRGSGPTALALLTAEPARREKGELGQQGWRPARLGGKEPV